MFDILKRNGKGSAPLENDNDIFKNNGKEVYDEDWFDQGERINELNKKGELSAESFEDLQRVIKDINWEETQKKLDEEINSLGLKEEKTEFNYTGQLKDIKFLIEDFNNTQKDLAELSKDNLADSSVFDAYKQVVSKEVESLEQLKQHTVKYISELGNLEEKVFSELGKKNEELIKQANEYNRELKHYDEISLLLGDLFQDASRTKTLIEQQTKRHKVHEYQRLESQLYSKLEESDDKISFLKQSYNSERDRSRFLNVAINTGKVAAARISNVQRALQDYLLVQESAIAVHYLADSITGINLNDAIASGSGFIEHYHKAVEKLDSLGKIDSVSIYSKLAQFSSSLGELDKRRTRRFTEPGKSNDVVKPYLKDKNKFTAK